MIRKILARLIFGRDWKIAVSLLQVFKCPVCGEPVSRYELDNFNCCFTCDRKVK